MKVKTLLKTLNNVDYVLMAESGWTREEGYVDQMGYWEGDSKYEDWKVVKITTVQNCDMLFITIKE